MAIKLIVKEVKEIELRNIPFEQWPAEVDKMIWMKVSNDYEFYQMLINALGNKEEFNRFVEEVEAMWEWGVFNKG